jgi:hypothetical protein
MQNVQNSNRNARHSRPRAPYNDRSKRGLGNSSRPPQNSHNPQGSYERYVTLAQAEAQSGNAIGAENYYQHAEHYFRMMSANKDAT